jgi:hypothetical protein
MKYAPLFVAVLIAVVVFGCGGSGGGGGGGTTTTGTTTTGSTAGDTIVTAIIAESSPGVEIDPTNLQVGDSTTFHLAQVDLTKGTYAVVPHTGYSTTDTNSVAGTLNAVSGAYVAKASSGGATFTISTNFQSATYTVMYAVTPVQGRVSGTVRDSNGFPVQFAVVLFFDGSSNQIGATTTSVSGSFVGSVPLAGLRFNLKPASLGSHYFQAFTYGSGTYAPLIKTCSAPLPALTAGSTSALSGPVVVTAISDANGVQNTPPPPPTCSP